MFNGIAHSGSTKPVLRVVTATAEAHETDDEDLWEGSRSQRVNSIRLQLVDQRREIRAQLGPLGRYGFEAGAIVSLYVGVRVACALAVDHTAREAIVGGAATCALGCAMAYAAQVSRRNFVMSQAQKALRRMERHKNEVQRATTPLSPRETELVGELEAHIAELRPFVQAQLIRRGG